MKNDPKMFAFTNRVNRHQKFKYRYYSKLIGYFEMINNDMEKLFTIEYWSFLDKLSDRGWFLPFMQTPDLPFIDNLDIAETYIISSMSSNKYEGLYYVKKQILNVNNLKNRLHTNKVNNFKDAIDNLSVGKYRTCARTMFALLESDHKKSSELTKISRGKERSIEISKYIDKIGIEYYRQTWEKIDKYYKSMNSSSNQNDKRVINRNELIHGDYENEVTLKDCLQLVYLYFSFKEISFNIQERNDLIKQLSEDILLLRYINEIRKRNGT